MNNNIPHKHIPLDTSLQAVAVKLSLHSTVTLCSIYLPPHAPIEENKLHHLISQLSSPFILTGNFNCHSTTWGCNDTNCKGLQLENIISNNTLSLLNDTKSKTYLHPGTGTYSSLDLSLCSPAILPDFEWKVGDDLHGSDHFPIFISSTQPSSCERSKKWKLSKAN